MPAKDMYYPRSLLQTPSQIRENFDEFEQKLAFSDRRYIDEYGIEYYKVPYMHRQSPNSFFLPRDGPNQGALVLELLTSNTISTTTTKPTRTRDRASVEINIRTRGTTNATSGARVTHSILLFP